MNSPSCEHLAYKHLHLTDKPLIWIQKATLRQEDAPFQILEMEKHILHLLTNFSFMQACKNLCISFYLYACIHPIFTLSLLCSGYCANDCRYGNEIHSVSWRRQQSSLMTRQKETISCNWEGKYCFHVSAGHSRSDEWSEYSTEGEGCGEDQEYGSGRAQATITSNSVREEVRERLGTGHPDG